MPFKKHKVIAIDGPAGSGKSTVSKILARRLGFLYVDTGAMYRAVTLAAIKEDLDFYKPNEIIKLAKRSQISLKNKRGRLRVSLNGRDVTRQIRGQRVNQFVSQTAKIEGVRRTLLSLQRAFARENNIVIEGRDVGTVIFPYADKKFYLDANLETRTLRRFKELKNVDSKVNLSSVKENIKLRDTTDSTRRCAPLREAKDAVYIDTTHMTIPEVVERMLGEILKNNQ